MKTQVKKNMMSKTFKMLAKVISIIFLSMFLLFNLNTSSFANNSDKNKFETQYNQQDSVKTVQKSK
jgi:hypothetical protein